MALMGMCIHSILGWWQIGLTQTHRTDYEETLSPEDKINYIGILLAIASFYNYEVWQMDVKIYFFKNFQRMCIWHNLKVLNM